MISCGRTVSHRSTSISPNGSFSGKLSLIHICYARAYGGRLLAGSAPERGACFSLCLPLCPPGAAPSVPDYMADRFSPLYVQLAPVCDLPL